MLMEKPRLHFVEGQEVDKRPHADFALLRKKLGLTFQEMAKALRIPTQTSHLNGLELGYRPVPVKLADRIWRKWPGEVEELKLDFRRFVMANRRGAKAAKAEHEPGATP
jgi:hypothetical protein